MENNDCVRLTHLINHIDYGGAEIGMVRLLNELRPDEFDITVVTLAENNSRLTSNLPDYVDLVELDLSSKTDFIGLIPLYRIFSETDVLVCSLFHSVVIGSVLGSIVRVPKRLAWHHNTTDNMGIREYIYHLAFRRCDRILTDSQATKEVVSGWGINETRIETLPISGIRMENYPTVKHDGTDGLRVGTVGRLVHQKGYDHLLTCAAQMPDFEYHVIGEGPLGQSLRDKSPNNVTFHGRVDDEELRQLWSSFDIYFQPSRYEGLCITAIEAMACGLPIVASSVGGLTESIVDGETGYLVERGDIDRYCTRLERLASNPNLRQKMGDSGRKRVESTYTAEEFAVQFRNIIFNV
jgi:glycosyltransferase involved in cell wall biosynthesis